MDLYLSLISILFSFSTIYITQKLFFKKNIIDIINKRSSHKVKATRNGGVSIFITIFVIALVFYIYGETIFDYSSLVPISLLLIPCLSIDNNAPLFVIVSTNNDKCLKFTPSSSNTSLISLNNTCLAASIPSIS